jgi:nitroimidazol reductase NimA-like FMN-containing flavoprotein (pyridoxamine 5'-phosphate oxidase superfamily)
MTDDPLVAHRLQLGLLEEQECIRLLGGAKLGRIALSVGALPAIYPIRFALLGGRDPVFRTHPQAGLVEATSGNVVCLQADDADPDSERGWSVMVTGPAEVLTDGDLLAEARELPLRPWLGDADAFVRIGAVMVSGRRIGSLPPLA